MTKTVAIIPARGGSQRIPGKNKKLFHGKPIIAYSIMKARDSKLFDDVYVSTDDLQIAEIAEMYGARVVFRDPEFCHDKIGTQEVAMHVIQQLSECAVMVDIACVIYPTAPLMRIKDMERGALFMKHPFMNYAFSVGTEPLSDAGQFYFGRAGAFGHAPLIESTTVMIPVPSNHVCDINTMEDWERAEDMYAALVK